MLATLFKDERCSQLSTYAILEKMYLDQIIRKKDLTDFEATLMEHQKAATADGQFMIATVIALQTGSRKSHAALLGTQIWKET